MFKSLVYGGNVDLKGLLTCQIYVYSGFSVVSPKKTPTGVEGLLLIAGQVFYWLCMKLPCL
ncbi:MAG: hypothetical protein ACJAS1_001471 [Oleiphilaceae bacterium]|jgi:hypothetical protein